MKLPCSDCGKRIWIKDIGREHTDWRTGETFYRCGECVEKQVAAFVARTCESMGLARLQI